MKKNRITYLFLLLLSIIFLYNYGGVIPSLFLNTLLSALVVSLGYTVYVYYRFKFIQHIDKRTIIKGEKVKLTIKLSNQDIFMYPYINVTFLKANSIFTEHNISEGFVIEPFSKKEFVFDLDCKYRGIYEVGISSIYIEDFFGLIRLKYKTDESKKIIVYPKIERLDNLDVYNTNNHDSQSISHSLIDDVVNIKDIRNYYYGDSLRKIHWKLTARNNKLMVKNYYNTSDANVTILMDYRKNSCYEDNLNISVEDKLIEAAASIISYYVSKNIPVNYVTYDSCLKSVRISDENDFEPLYMHFATVQFNQTVSLADFIKLQCESSMESFDMILLTSILDVELYNEIYNARISNHTVCLLYVTAKNVNEINSEISKEILENLPELGVKFYIVDPDDNLNLILGGDYHAGKSQYR